MSGLIRLALLLALLAQAGPALAGPLAFGPFGELILRGRQTDPALVAIVLSDDSGWGETEEELAKVAGEAGALVAGVDVKRYFANVTRENYEPNVSFELESMSKYVQKSLGLPRLTAPLLVGHGAGAGIVYASLAQAPAGTFPAGLSLGFRQELKLTQPFGIGRGLTWKRTDGGIRYEPFTKAQISWTVIQAQNDPVFPETALRGFIAGMDGVRSEILTGAAGYGDKAAWRDLVRGTLKPHAQSSPARDSESRDGVDDLPLVEVPAKGQATDTLAVFVTGDGGWAGIDRDIAAILADGGIGVVGLDSMKYFWTRRTPEGAGADLARIMRHYLASWGGKRVVLIGFSLGADALPPMVNALPPDLRGTVRQVTLLAPSRYVELEFHVSDWLHDNEAAQDIALLPEVRRLAPTPLLCVRGQEEDASLCLDLAPDEAAISALPGSHHFNGDYARVAALILEHLQRN
jgi:type IV secretory pathway VirJ component